MSFVEWFASKYTPGMTILDVSRHSVEIAVVVISNEVSTSGIVSCEVKEKAQASMASHIQKKWSKSTCPVVGYVILAPDLEALQIIFEGRLTLSKSAL